MSVKIILDTNWYISASINRKSRRKLYELITDRYIGILYSDELLAEYRSVISRTRFRKIVSAVQVSRFLNLILPRLTKVNILSSITMSRDPKDNYLLAMAMDSDADFLVTGDDDLLVLEQIGKTKIIRMAEFYETFVRTD